MLKHRVNGVRRVRASLTPAEISLNRTLGRVGKLMFDASEVQHELKLAPTLGQEALTHLAAASGMIGQAIERVIDAHHCFASDARTVLPELGFGPENCPPATAETVPDAGGEVIALRAGA